MDITKRCPRCGNLKIYAGDTCQVCKGWVDYRDRCGGGGERNHVPKVIIDGVEYVPRGEIPPLTDKRLINVLRVLTSMRYLRQDHKMMARAWEAIEALSPELAALEPEAAFDRMHNANVSVCLSGDALTGEKI